MSRESSFSCFSTQYFAMKFLLLISFALAAVSSTQSTNLNETLRHDVTTLLNNTIAKTFQTMDSDTIEKFVLSMETRNSFTFETYANCELGPFKNEFYFTNITVTPIKVESANMRHEFNRNRVIFFFRHLFIEMKGYLGATPDIAHVGFARSLDFENISIYVTAEPLKDLTKNEFNPYIEFILYEGYESNYTHSPWFHEDLALDIRHDLERRIKYFLPSLFEFNLQNNDNFRQTLRVHAMLSRYAEDEITSLSLFDIFETKHYFFIPNITSLHRTLSNITITGMHNFHSHSFAENFGQTTSTLTIKDVRGTTNLHYDGRNFTIFPLYFEVDCISITVLRKEQSINVTAHNYTVIETKMNVSLTEYQSKWVMEGIQLAIASSIMPSLKYYRSRNDSANSLEEHPILKISTKLSQQFEGSTIQKLYDTWNITIPESFNAESSIQIESNIYNISIDAKPETALRPYPDCIQCCLYSNLQFHYTIPSWLGKISVLNTTHEFDEIEFRMGRVIIVLVKQNNTNDFELLLHTSVTTDVELLSNPYNFTHNERLEIEQKTQQLIVSFIEKTVPLFARPPLSSPLDHCTSPVKIFDDFLPFYADYELPLRVPNSTISKINNVIITQWTKSSIASVWFNQDRFNGTVKLSTSVDLEFAEAKIGMHFNEEPFYKRHLILTTLVIRNYTDEGEIAVGLNSSPLDYVPQNNKTVTFSIPEIVSIDMKLRSILGECFNNLTSIVF
ncbi:uncharacterized protein LOC135837322 [Planococcus citri]|uniref:uncharacterized protein LOC135837322 n=1 Tax=Planococcus citri TaxID=170843 RepID=UPI0031F91CFE